MPRDLLLENAEAATHTSVSLSSAILHKPGCLRQATHLCFVTSETSQYTTVKHLTTHKKLVFRKIDHIHWALKMLVNVIKMNKGHLPSLKSAFFCLTRIRKSSAGLMLPTYKRYKNDNCLLKAISFFLGGNRNLFILIWKQNWYTSSHVDAENLNFIVC